MPTPPSFSPSCAASTALHPDSEHIPVTRANGILTSFVEPTGGIISGQGCLIDLNGWVPRELVIADAVALNVTIPDLYSRDADQRPARPGSGPVPDMGQAAAAPKPRRAPQGAARQDQGAVPQALAYDTVVTKAHERGEAPPAPDLRLEALVPYARGEKPVIFHADQQVEILDALDIARELKLKAVISGGSEAWKVADAIKKAKVPVLVGGTLNLPRHDYDPYDAAYANPAKLHAAGVTVAIHSQGGGAARATSATQPPLRGGGRRRLRPARRRRRSRPSRSRRRRFWASPTRSARSKPANGPTSSSRPAICFSRRRPCWPSSSTASRVAPREPPHPALRQVPPPAR